MFRSFLAALGLAFVSPALAQTPGDLQRGQALYSLHCSACHTAQLHWRDQKLAQDWATLRNQVRRWQSNEKLSWSETDIDDVSRYLNTFYYRYEAPEAPVSLLSPQRTAR